MENPRFSIITAVHIATEYRAQMFTKCIESINNQDFDHDRFEWIIVNDGSTLEYNIPNYPWIRVINQPNLQRITAYNNGFKEAKGEIFCVLDSDDEYVPEYLSTVDKWFTEFPEYKMFNFGATFISKDGGIANRDAFKPKELEVGHEIFGGGNVVWGTFVWHRSVYEECGAFGDAIIKDIDCTEINYPAGGSFIRELNLASPYDFSAWFQMKYPEVRKYFLIDNITEGGKIIKEIGNPFGQDYALFYIFTRKFKCKPIDGEYLYKVHLR